MNKAKYLGLLLFSICLFSSCEQRPDIDYKYDAMPKVVDCSGINSDLMHEALYSFEHDIGNWYNFKKFTPSMPVFFKNGYASYVYRGSEGILQFDKMASDHSKMILDELLKIEGLWIMDNERSNLNYEHEYVECLLSNIKNDEIKSTISSLREINSMSPKLMAEPYRLYVGAAYADDKHFAMYLALDTYYQYLIDAVKEADTIVDE